MKIFGKQNVYSLWKRNQHRVLSNTKWSVVNKKWVTPNGHLTNISIYNCITKSKVPLIIRNPYYVNWYMCGPTVYDSAHIGHACCYVKFDIIRRILQSFFNINIVMVMGITDIDDKIIARAAELKEEPKMLSRHYEAEFFKDMKLLNVIPPTISTRVTDFVPDIVSFVKNIIEKNQAYIMEDGSVYFDTSLFSRYGKLFPAQVDDKSEQKTKKKSALDFALWKGSKAGEPWWSNPWGSGKGRPGWHIECSAMASAIFGNNIDIHSGGVDLLFPHHENEEAQSCVYHGVHQWVNYWLHSGHLHLKGDDKMSKSLKNSVSIQEFLKSHSSNDFRIFCLLSQYRNGVEYTNASMGNAQAVCKKIESFLIDSEAYIYGFKSRGVVDEPVLLMTLADTQSKVVTALADDFDTGKAMNAIIELITVGNKMLHLQSPSENVPRCPGVIAAVALFIRETMDALGAQFYTRKDIITQNVSNHIQFEGVMDRVVQFRNDIRQSALDNIKAKPESVNNLKRTDLSLMEACDSFRDDLSSLGINIKDHEKQSSWSLAETNVKS